MRSTVLFIMNNSLVPGVVLQIYRLVVVYANFFVPPALFPSIPNITEAVCAQEISVHSSHFTRSIVDAELYRRFPWKIVQIQRTACGACRCEREEKKTAVSPNYLFIFSLLRYEANAADFAIFLVDVSNYASGYSARGRGKNEARGGEKVKQQGGKRRAENSRRTKEYTISCSRLISSHFLFISALTFTHT